MSEILSSVGKVHENLLKVSGLVVKFNPDHLAVLQKDEAAHAKSIQEMINHPHYIEDEFARRRMAPREIYLYGAVDYLPHRSHPLAEKYLQPGARVEVRTAMSAQDISELMAMPTLSVMVREKELESGSTQLLKIQIEDPRMPCAVGGTKLFAEAARAVTYMKCGDTAPDPCDTCRCPRKKFTPQP